MTSVIMQTTSRLVLYLLMTYSLFLLFRGHDAPGGGFIGGLLAAAAIVLQLLAFNLRYVERVFPIDFRNMAAWGLLLATGTGIGPMFFGYPLLTSFFWYIDLPWLGPIEVSTVLAFDIGVYLVVIGSVLTVVMSIAREPGVAAQQGEVRRAVKEDFERWKL